MYGALKRPFAEKGNTKIDKFRLIFSKLKLQNCKTATVEVILHQNEAQPDGIDGLTVLFSTGIMLYDYRLTLKKQGRLPTHSVASLKDVEVSYL